MTRNYNLYACNYADARFEAARKVNTASAYKKGKVDKVFEYSPEDIADFRLSHPDIFAYERGSGLWAWKPFVILQSLLKIEEGDWLIYCDSGAEYIEDIHILTDYMEKIREDVMLFQLSGLFARAWTKKETFELMCFPEELRDKRQILGGYSLWRKTKKNINFVQQWVDCCCNEKLISPKRFDETIKEDQCFCAHREDQSILYILAYMNGIAPFRDPSDYGMLQQETRWRKLEDGERHSPYPVMILSFRREDPKIYKYFYYKKLVLWRLTFRRLGMFWRLHCFFDRPFFTNIEKFILSKS